MVAKVANGNVSTGSETVEELLHAWLDHIGPNCSPTTIRKYRDLADRIVIPELGTVRLKALTAGDSYHRNRSHLLSSSRRPLTSHRI